MLQTPSYTANDMASQERSFYVALGQRLAARRKTLGITQVQLAEQLGIAQQTMAHYEGGVSRIAVETLALAAQTLQTSVEQLLGQAEQPIRSKRGPTSTLQKQIEQIHQLPRAKQKFVMDMLNTVIQQA